MRKLMRWRINIGVDGVMGFYTLSFISVAEKGLITINDGAQQSCNNT
jgi:uncharacterized membrane protein (Fun14 family)